MKLYLKLLYEVLESFELVPSFYNSRFDQHLPFFVGLVQKTHWRRTAEVVDLW